MTADEWKRAHDQERQAAVEASRDSARRAMDRGALITSMREAMGWSYRELGRRLDVSPSSVRRWELDGAPLIAYHAVRDIVRGEP
jgi:ribosome-binding protein aMBF1 (putative translation factor)